MMLCPFKRTSAPLLQQYIIQATRELCHLLQRSLSFTAEKLGKFTCVVCRKDCRTWDGTHCNLLLHTDGANASAVAAAADRADIAGNEVQVVSVVAVALI